MISIVFLDQGTVQAPLRAPVFEHHWQNYAATRAGEVRDRLKGATVIVTNKVKLGAVELAGLSELKLIALTATGSDNVDTAWCAAHGVGVANVPGYADPAVAEHVFLLMLALRRNLPAYQAALDAGAWEKSTQPNLGAFPIEDLAGSVLGLVGYGQLARAVEARAHAFAMHVLIAERKGAKLTRAGRMAFETVLEKSDVLSLHAPLVPETRHLLGAAEFARMKKSAILINTARGGLINERDLADALETGAIAGAGLDVLTEEPPRPGNSLRALVLPNLIITPHVAWMSRQAQQRLVEEVLRNIEAFVRGERRNRIV